MPQRSIPDFKPTDRWLDDEFYTADDLDQIVERVGALPSGKVAHERVREDGEGFVVCEVSRVEALAERLNSAARVYVLRLEWQIKPTGAQLARRHRQIEAAAEALLEALEAQGGEVDMMPDALRLESPSRNDVAGVGRLRCWAQASAARAVGAPAQRRHAGDEALDGFVIDLAVIWRKVLGRESVLSTNSGTGRGGGPFARFVRASLAPVSSHLPTETQIADRIKKLKDMGKLNP
jgi:hypothetical protein